MTLNILQVFEGETDQIYSQLLRKIKDKNGKEEFRYGED